MRQNLTWLYITAGFAFAGFAGFALFIYLNVGQYDDATAAPVTVSTTDKYLFSASTGTYSEITGGTLISNNSGLSTQVFNNQNIGFTFGYCGNEYTSISIATKGYIAMGGSVANSATPLSSGASNFVISPLGGNLVAQSGSTIRTQLTGTAPNRVFTVQWRNFRWSGATGDSYNFQLKLYESSNAVQFVYGSFTKNGTTREMQVGLRGASNTDFHTRTTTNEWSSTTLGTSNTATSRLRQSGPTVLPASGLTFTFSSPLIWFEDFALPNGSTQDAGSSAWSTTYGGSGGASVQNDVFRMENTGTEAVWMSEVIDISSVNYADVSVDISGRTSNFNIGFLGDSGPDYIRCYYRLDGGPEVLFFEHRSSFQDDNFDMPLSKVLKGNSVQIVVRTVTDRSRLLFLYFNDYYTIDNVSVSEVNTLYSRASGDWRNGDNWSVNDFSGPQAPAGVYPTNREVAIIGNGNTITLSNDEESALVEVRNSGMINLNTRILSMRRGGDVYVDSGGFIQNNNSNSTMVFSDPYMISNLVVNDVNGLDIGGLRLNNNVNLHISGPGSLNITSNFVFNGSNALVEIEGTEVSIAGNITGNQNNQIINRGTIQWAGTTWNARLFSGNSGTQFHYTRNGNQNVVTPEDSYNSLTLSGSGTKTAQGSFTVNGDVVVNNAAVFAMGNNNLTLRGNLTSHSSTANSVTGIARLIFEGTSDQLIDGANDDEMTIGAFTLNKAAGTRVVLSKPVRVTGTNSAFNSGIITSTVDYQLIFAHNATVSGSGNANSYVDGPITKIGNSAFIFPVGSEDYWAPIQISDLRNSQNTTQFTAQYSFSIPPNSSLVQESISHISELEYWNLSRTFDPGNDAECYVTLYFPDQERSQIVDVFDLTVAHFNSTDMIWENLGAFNVTGNSIRTTNRVANFSPFTIASAFGNNPLPVELKEFTARYTNDQVLVSWSTLTELNNDYFTVEHSVDGLSFSDIGRVQGYGTTNEPQFYTFTHDRYQPGVNYYRLKQTDFDGTMEVFRPVYLHISSPESVSDISLYPNPVSRSNATITVDLRNFSATGGPTDVLILNNLGQQVYTERISSDSGQKLVQVDLGYNVSSGVYFAKVVSGSSSVTKKFMVE